MRLCEEKVKSGGSLGEVRGKSGGSQGEVREKSGEISSDLLFANVRIRFVIRTYGPELGMLGIVNMINNTQLTPSN